MNEDKNLEKNLEDFLETENQEECVGDECLIKTDKSLVERINKKIITEDGRQLLT
jgi:hypothetical protein